MCPTNSKIDFREFECAEKFAAVLPAIINKFHVDLQGKLRLLQTKFDLTDTRLCGRARDRGNAVWELQIWCFSCVYHGVGVGSDVFPAGDQLGP